MDVFKINDDDDDDIIIISKELKLGEFEENMARID